MRTFKAIRAALVLTAGLPLVLAGSAQAYVRSVTDSGLPTWWRNPCVAMDLHLDVAPPAMAADEYLQAATTAAEQWGHSSLSCSGLAIEMRRLSEASTGVGFDGKNSIVFWRDSWSKHPVPEDPAAIIAYAPNAFAVTTVFKSKTTGEIVDADIEINAVRFAWADLAAHPELAAQGMADFQNTLTHELGHVIGLAHPCYSANDGAERLNDNNGAPELDCKDPALPPVLLESTMFPAVATSDTQRRTLSADDQQAVCEMYPAATATCHEGQKGGCAVAGSAPTKSGAGSTALLALALTSLAALLARGRRSRH